MSDLLRILAAASARRAAAARARHPESEMLRRARSAPDPVKVRLDSSGFDLIAEIKLRSPSRGRLADPREDAHRLVRMAAAAYAAGGAAAISVLTEPAAFHGALSHLQAASEAVSLPVIRKDFLVDPYQVLEARAAGASGVLLIVKLLADPLLRLMLDACARLGMFALLEASDRDDASRIGWLLGSLPSGNLPEIIVGANARDLRSLAISADRLEALVPRLPSGFPKVAESGLESEEDAARIASLGFQLALVGTALMRSHSPKRLAAALIRAGRAARPSRAVGGG